MGDQFKFNITLPIKEALNVSEVIPVSFLVSTPESTPDKPNNKDGESSMHIMVELKEYATRQFQIPLQH